MAKKSALSTWLLLFLLPSLICASSTLPDLNFTTSDLPNLTPYQPSGWSDNVVVSKVLGSTTDSSPLYPTDTLYVDWAVINNGSAATAARFYTSLYVDGVYVTQWYSDPPLNPNYYTYVNDYSLGTLSVGTHTIRIVADSTNVIAESNENDNDYTKTITVIPLPTLPNLPLPTAPLAGSGGTTETSLGQGSLVTAYGQITTTTPTQPAALANFGFTQNGILTTEAGVAASAPTTAARIFVDYSTAHGTDSGVAVANPSNNPITVNVQMNNAPGAVATCPSQTVAAKGHLAMFASQLCPNIANPFLGTLTLTSSTAFVATNLQLGTNSHGEPLYNSLPVATPNAPPAGNRLYFSQFADGGGFSTEILLMNLTGTTIIGTVSFLDNNGHPVTMNFGPSVGSASTLNYSITGNGMQKYTTAGSAPGTSLQTGFVVVTSTSGALPAGAIIFSRYNGTGGLASLAGVLNSPLTTNSRMYVEKSNSPLTRDTGLAIVNPNNSVATVQLNLISLDGSFTASNTITLLANSHMAAFIDQSAVMGAAATSIPANFQGVLTLSSNLPIAPVTLRLTNNQRGEDLYSTLPVVDLNNSPTGPQYLPQIADGDGYTTQIILINTGSSSGTVTMNFFNDNGTAVQIPFNWATIWQTTTKVLDQQGMGGLTVSANGSTLTLPASSLVGKSLLPGDVLAIGVTSATPKGLLRKVVSISQNGSQIVVTTTQGTLADIFQQANFSFHTNLTFQNIKSTKSLLPGVSVTPGNLLRKFSGSTATPNSLQNPCADNSITLTVPIGTSILDGRIHLNGEIDVCPGFEFDWQIGGFPPKLGSLTAAVMLSDYVHINAFGGYQGKFDQRLPLAEMVFEPISVPVGPVVLVLVPKATFFVGASGDVKVDFSAGAAQAATVTAGLSYENGKLSPFLTPTSSFALDPFGLDAGFNLKAYAGVTVGVSIEDIVTPSFSPDTFLQLGVDLLKNPWWTLSAGLEGDANVDVSLFGFANLAKFDFPDLFQYSKTIAQANGSFVPSSAAPTLNGLNPNAATAGSPGQTLTVSGSNFVPGAVVKFNGAPLSTNFVNPQQVTATLTASNLAAAGTFPVTATNPDASTVLSNALSFTVGSSTGNPPTVVTGAATNLTSNSVTLNGTVNPNGLTTTAYFQWGTTTSYGNTTPTQSFSGNSTLPVSANLPGLSANTTYHYRLVASNNAGPTNGVDQSFITSGGGLLLQGKLFAINGTISIAGNTLSFEIQALPNSDGSYFVEIDDELALPSFPQFLAGFYSAPSISGNTVVFSGPAFSSGYQATMFTLVSINSVTLTINFTSLVSGSPLSGNVTFFTSSGPVQGTFTGTLTI